MEQPHGQHDHHKHHHGTTGENEVTVTVSYEDSLFTVHITNRDNYEPPVLEQTHEELMHLIIVSEDLNEYYHLHPVQKNDATFIQEIELTGGKYKAFVDINPQGRNYVIEPIPFTVSSNVNDSHVKHHLEVDHQLTKNIEGKTVELKHDPLKTGKKVNLTFDVKNAKLEPYLGALGHVVIIDKEVEKFIHVHPKSDHGTVFETHFDNPGIYKLWAEFKFADQVIAFPYVMKVK